MKRKKISSTIITYILIASMISYSTIGCGSSSKALTGLQKYDSMEYADVATFYAPVTDVADACRMTLNEKGFTIDEKTAGIYTITADLKSGVLLPEEVRQEHAHDASVGDFIVTLISFVLIVGIIAMAITDMKNNDSSSSGTEVGMTTDIQDESAEQSYIYSFSFSIESRSDTSAACRLYVTRSTVEDSIVVQTVQIENKYINYGLFDAIQEKLDRAVK